MAKASPRDVVRFHREYDTQKDHRVRLFAAIADVVRPRSVLYPGSYVDIAPSVFFDDVVYVDIDKRAARFFAQQPQVLQLIGEKRARLGRPELCRVGFEHRDYRTPLDVDNGPVELLISLFAGFISEHCTRYLAPGAHLLVNDRLGDASMASLDPSLHLVGVVLDHEDGDGYRVSTDDLDDYLIPKRGPPPTAAGLRGAGRGFAYTRRPFAYLFQREDSG